MYRNLTDALESFTTFFNVPTSAVLLPTRSKWVVLWYNDFLCSGYDSLCWCLTSHHSLTTIHWSAHNDWTTFQSGSAFCFRKNDGGTVFERQVYAAQDDDKWVFFEKGRPLAEEDVGGYSARKKRDRLNERRTVELLSRLGAAPWAEAFYRLPGEVFTVSRVTTHTLPQRSRDQVLRPLG